jgi:acyl-CoA synthetase (AMP-forming)/AMP-acid ligase II
MNIISRLEINTKAHPDKLAFIFYSPRSRQWETVTFQQLADSTQRIATGLQACGVTPGMRAALMTPPSTDFFALAFAMLKLGIIPVILDPSIGLQKVTECLAEAKPDIFIGNRLTHALRIVFGWGKDSIKHNLTIQSISDQKSKIESLTTDHSLLITDFSPAAIIYTSGSTGIPKGVLYTHANFAAQLDMLVDTFNISPDEIDLPAFPLYALIDALIGVTSVIPDITFPVPGKTNAAKVINAIQKFKVTNMFASPVVLDILEKFWSTGASSRTPQQQAAGLQSLKRVITAGAPATIQLQESFRKLLNDETDLFGTYGATEVLPIAKIESREIFEVRDKSAKGAGVCLGKPVNGAKVRVIQISESAIQQWRDELEVNPNIVGEITVQGAAVTESYIARKEANLLSKIHDGDKIIHRMGDVGYFDEQGRLWYCGRKSHRVSTNDDVLFTEQIEGIFNVHPLVYRTALVGVDKEPVLWIELAKNTDKEKIEHDLMDLAKDHLQASRIKKFLFMKKFPTDVRHNSKIIREQLTLLAQKRLR